MILLVTNELDFSVDPLIDELENMGQHIFRLNTEKIGSDFHFDLNLSQGSLGRVYSSDREVFLEEVKSVFFRRPKLPNWSEYEPGIKSFMTEEFHAFLRWTCTVLKDRFWVSEPHSVRRAESKFDQLLVASQLGFCVPKTKITTDPERAKEFLEGSSGTIITKTLRSSGFDKEDGRYHIYATPLTQIDSGLLERVNILPSILQEYVSKKLELRVTVVGEKVFACSIDSQSSSRTQHDWRRYDFDNTAHKAVDLPQEVVQKCLSIVKHYGLNYGAIDLILTPADEYVFLELNPNGQWLWIEKLTDLKITAELARLLSQVDSL